MIVYLFYTSYFFYLCPMSNEVSKRYAQRGVSAAKEDVHNAIKNVDKGFFMTVRRLSYLSRSEI